MKNLPNLKRISFFIWPLAVLLLIGLYRTIGVEKYAAGKALYAKHCASCHMEDGSGLRAIMPPLAGADYVIEHGADMACIIRYGMEGQVMVNGVLFDRPMYGQPDIKEVEIRNIINYIKHAWGNPGPEVSFAEVKEALKACEGSKTVPTP